MKCIFLFGFLKYTVVFLLDICLNDFLLLFFFLFINSLSFYLLIICIDFLSYFLISCECGHNIKVTFAQLLSSLFL